MKDNFKKIIKNKYVIGGLLVVLCTLTIMTSYSYFANSTGDVQTDIEAGFAQMPTLVLTNSGDVNMELNSSTFGVGASNLVSDISSTVTLKVVYNELYTTTYDGYIELENEFVYSDGETPDLLLQVSDSFGNNVTEIEGLDYVTVNGVSGFDITQLNGKIQLFEDDEISTSSFVSETWNYSIILLAHEYDQSVNMGANFSATFSLEVYDENTIVEDLQ